MTEQGLEWERKYATLRKERRERRAMMSLDRWFARFENKIDWLEKSIIEKTDSSYFDTREKNQYRFTGAMLDEFVKAINERMAQFAQNVKNAYALSEVPFMGSETAKKHIND